MAAALVDGVGSPLLLHPLHRRDHFLISHRQPVTPVFFSRTVVSAAATSPASSSTAASVETEPDAPALGGKGWIGMSSLACPICYNTLTARGGEMSKRASGVSGVCLDCSTCRKTYASNEAYVDLTVSGGSKEYTEAMPASTELFRSPLVSFLYERGWRQNFVLGGFPGPEKKFEMAKAYFKPTVGGTIVDASCASGMFSRLFASSKLYSLVIALDFSENMLQQCNDFINQEGIPREYYFSLLTDKMAK